MTGWRVPWLTLGLVLANVVVFSAQIHFEHRRERDVTERGTEAISYFNQHPGLAIKPPLDEFVPLGARGSVASVVGERSIEPGFLVDRETAAQQAQLDDMVAAFAQAAQAWQSVDWGFSYGITPWWTLLTYQFLHTSWWHVTSNMLLLIGVGPLLEKRFGRPRLLMLYVAAGIIAALSQSMQMRSDWGPLLGASGGVASLLAAAACQTPIIPRRLRHRGWQKALATMTFRALLAVWLCIELTQAIRLREHASVAHLAHLGGFMFGLIVAMASRFLARIRPCSE